MRVYIDIIKHWGLIYIFNKILKTYLIIKPNKIYDLLFIVLFIYCYHNIGGDSNKKKYNEELFHQQ